MSEKPILGADGKPLKPAKEETSLPLEIQALVEARVNTQLDAAREMLRHEASDARRETNVKALIRYGTLVVCNVLFAIFIWVFDSSEVKELTRKYVTENMNKPTLEEAARDVVTNKMASFVIQQLRPLAQGVTSIRSNIADADQAMRQLRDEQRLITVVGRAEALDADALRELLNLAQGTNETASLADAMVRSIQRTLRNDRGGLTYEVPLLSAGEHQYGGPFADDELASQLTDRAGVAVGAVNIIANERRMVFVPDLVEIAHTSKDLWLLNRVSLALEKMVGVKFSAWDVQPLDRWWSAHKASYTNWPRSEYEIALTSIRACTYDVALAHFESVLAADPKADKSRALAVACAAEVGNIPKANQLNSGYDQKDGRWERWAAGKMLLTTGAVERATRAFASLVDKHPIMTDQGFVQRGSHILRNLDWALFSQLVSGPTNAAPKKTEVTR